MLIKKLNLIVVTAFLFSCPVGAMIQPEAMATGETAAQSATVEGPDSLQALFDASGLEINASDLFPTDGGDGKLDLMSLLANYNQTMNEAQLKKALKALPKDKQDLILQAKDMYKDFATKILVHNIFAQLIKHSHEIITTLAGVSKLDAINRSKTTIENLIKVCDEILQDTTGQYAQTAGPLGLPIKIMPLQACPPREAEKLACALDEVISESKQFEPLKISKNDIETLHVLKNILTAYASCFKSTEDTSDAAVKKNIDEILAQLIDYVGPEIEEIADSLKKNLSLLSEWKDEVSGSNKNLEKSAQLWIDELESYKNEASFFSNFKDKANIHGKKYSHKIYQLFSLTYNLFSKFYEVYKQKPNTTRFDIFRPFHTTNPGEFAAFSVKTSIAVLGFLNQQSDDYANVLFQVVTGRTNIKPLAKKIPDLNDIVKSGLLTLVDPSSGGLNPIIVLNINAVGISLLNKNSNNTAHLLCQYLKLNPIRTKLIEKLIDVAVAWTYYQFSCASKKQSPEAWPKDFPPLKTAFYNLIVELKSQIVSEITHKIKGQASQETLNKIESFTMGLLKPELATLAVNFALQWLLVNNQIPGLNKIIEFDEGSVFGDAYTGKEISFKNHWLDGKSKLTQFIDDYGYYKWADEKYFEPNKNKLRTDLDTLQKNTSLTDAQKTEEMAQIKSAFEQKSTDQSIALYMRYKSIEYVLQSLGEFWGRKIGQKFNGPIGKAVSWTFCKLNETEPKELKKEMQTLKMPLFMAYQMFMSNPATKPNISNFLAQGGFIPAFESAYEIKQEIIDRGLVSWFLFKLSSSRIITPLEAAKALKFYDLAERNPELYVAEKKLDEAKSELSQLPEEQAKDTATARKNLSRLEKQLKQLLKTKTITDETKKELVDIREKLSRAEKRLKDLPDRQATETEKAKKQLVSAETNLALVKEMMTAKAQVLKAARHLQELGETQSADVEQAKEQLAAAEKQLTQTTESVEKQQAEMNQENSSDDADGLDMDMIMQQLMPPKFNAALDSITTSLKATLIGRSVGKITGFLVSTWPMVKLADDGVTKFCDWMKKPATSK